MAPDFGFIYVDSSMQVSDFALGLEASVKRQQTHTVL